MTVALLGSPPPDQRTWLVHLLPTRADWPSAITAAERDALGAHFRDLQAAVASGTCVVAGPREDSSLGVAIFDGVDEATMLAMLQADPMVASGYFRAEVSAFRLSLERGRPTS